MDDLATWLEQHGLDRHLDVLVAHDIDLDILPEITDADLKELGFSLGVRKRFLVALRDLAVPVDAAAAPAETVSDPSGARRQVTVLFVDLSGFTALSSERDPEEVHALLQRYFAVVDEKIRAFGGTVDKHIGDGAMAVFGAPVAHTDDPERAVRTALDIHAELAGFDPPLQAHIGIASGQVVASTTGSDTFAEYTMTGASVNLAARLQDLAGAGETFISGNVKAALGGHVTCREIGDERVKGFADPVSVWRVEGIAAGTSPEAEVLPFVGRVRERRQLETVLADCRSRSAGQAVLLRGDPGIGKSRLADWFREKAERDGVACHSALILDFSAGKGRDAVPALVRSLLGIAPGSGKTVRRAAADAAIEAGTVATAHWMFLLDLLDLPQSAADRAALENMDHQTRLQAVEAAVGALVCAVAADGPLLLRVEDVHWADTLLLDRLAAIAARITAYPVLLLMTTRVEADPIDAAWRTRSGNCPVTTIDLGPLTDSDAEALAERYLDANAKLARACISRAAGNPLFLDQLLRNAQEGAGDEVPGSVQSIVQTRLDRLDPLDRQGIQAASVLGQRFSADIVAFMIEQEGYDCSALLSHQLARPEQDGLLFSHALVRDGVYATMLKPDRERLHIRAAEWFKDSDPVLHARHLEAAGDAGAAGAYLVGAQFERDAFHDDVALDLVGDALRLAGETSIRFPVLLLKAELLRRLAESDASIACYEDALALAEGPDAEITCHLGIADGHRILDRFDAAFAALDRAETTMPEPEDRTVAAEIAYRRGNLCFPLGRTKDCLRYHSAALDHARAAGADSLVIQALGGLGDANYALGRIVSARARFQECVTCAQEAGLKRIEVVNAPMLGWTTLLNGEFNGSRPILDAAAESAKAIGGDRAQIIVENGRSMLALDQGDLKAAETFSKEIIRLSERLSSGRFLSYGLNMLAQVALARGDKEAARGFVDQALAAAEGPAIGFCGPWIYATAAQLADAEQGALDRLREGERLLAGGAVAHNHYFFRREALDVCLRFGNWEALGRQVAEFRAYLGSEITGWARFFIERAEHLALVAQEKQDADVRSGIATLIDFAAAEHLSPPISSLLQRAADPKDAGRGTL